MPKTLRVEFDDFPDDWIEVIISPVPVATLFAIISAVRGLRTSLDDFGNLFGLFAPFVESWSYAEPPGVEGLMARDYNLALAAIAAWIGGVRDAPLPLPRRSSASAPESD